MSNLLKTEIKMPAMFQRKKVSLKSLVQFTRQSATLVRAGLPLAKTLVTLRQQLDGSYLEQCITDVERDVQGGTAYSEALRHHPTVFPPIYVNMVKAGEQGGMLDEILKRLAELLEKQERLRSRVRSALMYPLLVMIVAVLILVMLMVFVVPTFTKMFDDLGGALPAPTQVLIFISDTLRYRWYLVLAVAAGVMLLLSLMPGLVGRQRWRLWVDGLRLRLPVFGQLIRKLAVARFARTLGTLLTSGVPILNALETVREVVGNEVVAVGIDGVRLSIREGESVADPLSRCPAFDPVMIKMVAVGEETGQLDKMLVEVADSYEEEVDIMVSGLTSLLEPLLIVFMGGMVGFIVISMFLPLFTLAKLIS